MNKFPYIQREVLPGHQLVPGVGVHRDDPLEETLVFLHLLRQRLEDTVNDHEDIEDRPLVLHPLEVQSLPFLVVPADNISDH